MLKSLVIALCSVSAALCNTYSDATQYQITEISHAYEVEVRDINDSGVVLGTHSLDRYVDDFRIGFIWDQGQGMRPFSITEGQYFRATAINNSGNVSFKLNGICYFWNPTNSYTPISTELLYVYMNNNNEIIGYKPPDPYDDEDQPVPYSSVMGCTLDDLKLKAFGKDARSHIYPMQINDQKNILVVKSEDYEKSDIIGYWEVWDSKGHIVLRPGPSDCFEIVGIALNNSNDVVGYETDDNDSRGFFWTANGQKLALLSTYESTVPSDVNDKQQAVGTTYSQFDQKKAFVWDPSLAIVQDLNECIPQDSKWELAEAVAINNNGQIVGMGWKNGIWSAFLLDPIAN